MYYAHSTEDPDRDRWQRLAEHLANVSREAAARAELFGAGRTAALASLFHDLGKYAPAFQAYISGNGESPDHATAGAQEIWRSVSAARTGSPRNSPPYASPATTPVSRTGSAAELLSMNG